MSNLTAMDQAFADSPAQSNSNSELPVGKYVCVTSDPEVFESKEGRSFFKFKLTVTEGDFKGISISKLYPLDAPERFRFLKGDLITLGIMIGKLSDLESPDVLKKFVGIHVDVSAVAGKDTKYTNYYINSKAKPAAGSTGSVPF